MRESRLRICSARLGCTPLSISSITTMLPSGADSTAAAIARTRSVPSDNKVASYPILLPPKVSVSATIASLRGVSMKSMLLMSCSGRAWMNWRTSRSVLASRQRLYNTPGEIRAISAQRPFGLKAVTPHR